MSTRIYIRLTDAKELDVCSLLDPVLSAVNGNNAKFRTINNVDRACLKSSADGGGIMTFMYYYANGVGGWQQMTPAPTEC